jgi:hypothetical protein
MLTSSDRTIRAFRTAADMTKKSVVVGDVTPNRRSRPCARQPRAGERGFLAFRVMPSGTTSES